MTSSAAIAASPPVVEADELFRRHAGFVAAFLRQLGATRADLDDLVQDVFMVAHEKGGFVPGQAKPTTWLGAIAYRRFQNHRRLRIHRDESVPSERFDDRAAAEPSPLRAAETRQALHRIDDILSSLGEDQRVVFILREIEGDSCVAIAEELGAPVGTIYSRLHDARNRVRERYAKLTGDPEEK